MAFDNSSQRKDPNYIFSLERNLKQYMFILLLGLFMVIALLVVALTILMPLKQKEPYLVFFSNADTNFVRVEPANYDITADSAILKGIIAGYVKKRETINRIDDLERYEEIRIQSNSNVWRFFNNLVTQKGSVYATKGIYRDIQIINSSILSDSVATVDFTATIISTATAEKTFKRYRATLSYAFENQEINFDSLPQNPTGFVVNEYALTEIDLANLPISNDKDKDNKNKGAKK